MLKKKQIAKSAPHNHAINPKHRMEGKDLEVFRSILNYLELKDDRRGGCQLWPKRWPADLPKPRGYSLRVSSGYGVFVIHNPRRDLTAHRAVWVNCHKANPQHLEVQTSRGKVDQIRHNFCETPTEQLKLPDGTTFGRWGGNTRCVCENHIWPGSAAANRLDRAISLMDQRAIDRVFKDVPKGIIDLIAQQDADPQTIVQSLKLTPSKLGYKKGSGINLLGDVAIVQIATRQRLLYPAEEGDLPEIKLFPKPKK